MKYTFVFPGQGSQFVGMGKELADNFQSARDVFQEVNDAVSQDLFKLMVEGPEHELTLTANAQPALMANSMAVVRVLEKDFGIKLKDKASFVAGHSLGEYSAACAAGVFSLRDTAKLLRTRGEAMQQAVPVGVGGMAAVIGVSYQDVQALAEACADDNNLCVAANDNADGQVVLSGHMAAIDKAVEIASEFGAKRCIKLPVSAPFHSPLMQPAAEVMAKALAEVEAHKAEIPLIANVLATAISDEKEIVKHLIEQVTGSVRWRESVNYMADQGVTDVVELGAGKVLSGIIKRSHKEINKRNLFMFELHDKVALITGAAGGLGDKIARTLHKQGATLALTDMRAEPMEKLKAELGDRVEVFTANLTNPEDVKNLVAQVEEKLGRIDILVNNAGLTRDNLFIRMSDEDWQLVLDVNLSAGFKLAKAAVRGMMKRRFGRIIGIASVVGVTGNAGQANYSASKAGMIAMNKCLAQEVGSRGITVNSIAPGFIRTPMTDVLPEDVKAALLAKIPEGKLGEAQDIANVVAFLASDEAQYITGQTININGGMAMI